MCSRMSNFLYNHLCPYFSPGDDHENATETAAL
jgi:hypothetical protein